MAQPTDNKKVSAIVPAHNEAERIGRVLAVLTTSPHIREVVVVDDGSTDGTAAAAARYPVRVLRLGKNQGKGRALDAGVGAVESPVLLFCDADMQGITHQMIAEIIQPVAEGKLDMFIAMMNRRSYALRFMLSFVPLLGGQRALARELWQRLPEFYKDRFRVETALNFYAKYYGLGFGFKVFTGLGQTIKEKKYGLLSGFYRRALMLYDVFGAQARLQLASVPHTLKSKRLSALGSLVSLGGLGIGALVLAASYTGPLQFLQSLFAERLREDPSTPVVDYLLYLAAAASRDLLLFFGALLILINFFFLALETRHLVGWRVAEAANGRKNFSES
ncbi:MAG: Glycosyl transferase family 2 [Candidatus Magasanikbacteria bacterium GW2011_GWA2_56_11]|uniref:Glycosyl transferase family 2 n=1 Tax=Candidatus Magasanikbacteria bacterium GW2011_GWA2_56_11 TaxID=1619044 RepID=A0A0G1YFJ6_9BACT|nr:MAG: Glycosyl transferase family 2 [Candidatus Magasanikbacteria bacterium GW2011_GWA2_56_11]